jgi:XTP/dITP diphosphohydrolase
VTTLIIATRNRHKVEEIRAVLSTTFDYITLRDLPGAPHVIEDADTFAGNASKKALELARWAGNLDAIVGQQPDSSEIFCLADDSGLEVDALNGAPGVLSARFAAPPGHEGNTSDQANNQKLLRLLDGIPAERRTARFRCVIALATLRQSGENPGTELFDGVCEGRIIEVQRGSRGFGYDPLFVPEGFERTFAELGEDQKNKISHRAKALQQVDSWFRKRASAH